MSALEDKSILNLDVGQSLLGAVGRAGIVVDTVTFVEVFDEPSTRLARDVG